MKTVNLATRSYVTFLHKAVQWILKKIITEILRLFLPFLHTKEITSFDQFYCDLRQRSTTSDCDTISLLTSKPSRTSPKPPFVTSPLMMKKKFKTLHEEVRWIFIAKKLLGILLHKVLRTYQPTPPPLCRLTQVAPRNESPMTFCTAMS